MLHYFVLNYFVNPDPWIVAKFAVFFYVGLSALWVCGGFLFPGFYPGLCYVRVSPCRRVNYILNDDNRLVPKGTFIRLFKKNLVI